MHRDWDAITRRETEVLEALRERLTNAEIAWAMGSTGAPPAPGARDPELSSIGRDALDGLGADRTTARARLLAALSSHYSVGGDPVLGYEYSEEALAIARELDDPRTLGAVLLARRYAGGLPITPIDRLAIADELVEIGQRTGDPTFTVFGLAARVWSHRELADLAAHDRALEQFDRRLGDHPLAYARVMREISYGIRHVLRGNLGVETQEHAQRAIELEREVQFQQGTTIAQPFLMSLLLHRGELGDGLDLIQRTRGAQPEFGPAYDAVEAVALCQVGRRHEAATLLAHHLANGFDAPPNLSLTSTLALFAEVSDHLGDVAAAEALHDRLSPFAGLLADSGAAVVTDVDLSLLQTAIVAGHDDAHERALALVARCRALDTPLVLGRALLRLAVTSDRTAGTDTTPDAMVEEALAIADATGCRLISLDAQRLGVA